MALALVLVTLVTLIGVGTGLPNIFPPAPVYIIGGNTTDIKLHPYQVSIWFNHEFRGSGALVAKHWVVTCASRVVGFDAKTLTVRVDSSFASSGGELYNVSKVLIHPRFCFSNMTFDVALLRLSFPLMQTSLPRRWIPLARRPLPTNITALLSGWGSTTMKAKMSDQLTQTSMRPVARNVCQENYTRQILHTQFCSMAVDGYGPCWGDNGDLLVYEGRLYGLLSWNKGCFDEVVPSVFTDIRSVYHWVLKVIKRSKHILTNVNPL